MDVLVGTLSTFWVESCMIDMLEGVLEQMSKFLPSWCFLALLGVLIGTLSTFWAESCMIDMLGGVLEQNGRPFAILVLLSPI